MYATITVLLIISLEASQQIFRVYDRFKIIRGAYTWYCAIALRALNDNTTHKFLTAEARNPVS